MKLLVKVRYDGAAYCGFQVQPNGTSVQAVLTRAAEDVFGFPVNVTGCSRTDAGVHAEAYIANFRTNYVPSRPAPKRSTAYAARPTPRADIEIR